MEWLYGTPADFSGDEYDRIYATLSPSRAKKIKSLKRPEDRIRSLTGDLLAQKLLAQMGVSNAVLEVAPSGQPVLSGCELFISLSHSEKSVVCAVAETPVGIDIEKIRPVDLAISRHICTAEEAEYLFGHPPCKDDLKLCEDPEILHRFFEIWTGKEAYFKQQGTGITDLRSIHILPLPRKIILKDGFFITVLF